MKKISLLFVAFSISASVLAETDNKWNLQGSGTVDEPYLICNADDFLKLAANCTAENTGAGEFFLMVNDIDFGGTAEAPVQLPAIARSGVKSITSQSFGFDGIFDGNGKRVSGIYHTNNQNDDDGKFNALFSYISENGVVKNVTISADNVINSYMNTSTIASLNKGLIDGCVNNANVTGTQGFASGICSYLVGGKATISNCTNNGAIIAKTYAAGIVSGTQSGGSIGKTDADYLNYLVDKCTNNGAISTTDGMGSAGIAGSFSGVITNCVNNGTIDDSMGTSTKGIKNTAGIVSCMTYVGGVSGNENRGVVTGGDYVGGIVGIIMKGSNEAFDVTNNINSGTVSGTGENVGDILGGTAREIANGIASVNEECRMKNEDSFNLAGQRISNTAKGLFITHGKKLLSK